LGKKRKMKMRIKWIMMMRRKSKRMMMMIYLISLRILRSTMI
jgi:hypothetical protein